MLYIISYVKINSLSLLTQNFFSLYFNKCLHLQRIYSPKTTFFGNASKCYFHVNFSLNTFILKLLRVKISIFLFYFLPLKIKPSFQNLHLQQMHCYCFKYKRQVYDTSKEIVDKIHLFSKHSLYIFKHKSSFNILMRT